MKSFLINKNTVAGLLLPIFSICCIGGVIADGVDNNLMPKNYDGFELLTPREVVKLSDLRENYFFLDEGEYYIDNPIRVSRNEPILIHGIDRVQTRLIPKDKDKPLFVIENASYISLANIRLQGDGMNSIAIEFQNDEELLFEVQDVFFDGVKVVINGPGQYTFQNAYMTGRTKVDTQIYLNHANANLNILGGNIKNSGVLGGVNNSEYAHITAEKGRMSVLGLSVQRSLGYGDFRIDSGNGSQQLINIRSEGNNGLVEGGSSFVYASSESEDTDVLIVNSSGSWRLSGENESAFAKFNSSGVLGIIGSISARGVGSQILVGNNAASYYFCGNVFSNNQSFNDISGAALSLNYRAERDSDGKYDAYPHYSQVSEQRNSNEVIGEVEIRIPEPLSRPVLNFAIGSFVNVKDYGAKGNGLADDSIAIQNAFNNSRYIYFPEGVYRITKPLTYNYHHGEGHGAGGWISGSGRRKSMLVNTSGTGVFKTRGMAYATISDISFTDQNSKDGFAVISIENEKDVGHASQSNTFKSLAIEGGYKGVSIGDFSKTQCSENLFNDVSINNSKYAVSIGSYNALSNIFFNLDVNNADYVFGHHGELVGGTWSIVGGRFKNIRKAVNLFRASSDGVWFYDGIEVDHSKFIEPINFAAPLGLFINRSHFENVEFEMVTSGGIFLNKSKILNGKFINRSHIAHNYTVLNKCEVDDYETQIVKPSSFKVFH